MRASRAHKSAWAASGWILLHLYWVLHWLNLIAPHLRPNLKGPVLETPTSCRLLDKDSSLMILVTDCFTFLICYKLTRNWTSYASFQDTSNCGQRSPSLEERISLTSTSGLLESPATPRKSWLIFTATPTLLGIGCSSNIPSTMSGKNLSEWDSSLPQSLRWCTKAGSTPVSEFTSMTQNWEKSSLSNNTICHLVILTLRQVFSLLINVFFVVQPDELLLRYHLCVLTT